MTVLLIETALQKRLKIPNAIEIGNESKDSNSAVERRCTETMLKRKDRFGRTLVHLAVLSGNVGRCKSVS